MRIGFAYLINNYKGGLIPMGYQTILNEIDEFCGGDISKMETFSKYLSDYIVQIKQYASEDQMLIHGFCD